MTMPTAEKELATDHETADERQVLRVLVADDDELLATSLCHHVEQLGYKPVGPASNGEMAVELAKQLKPDLALLDLRMPVMDGLGAGTVLFKHMGIPVVIVSAHSDPEYLEAGEKVGVFGYLIKPVTIDQLRVNLGVAWARFRQYEKLRCEVQDLKSALEDRKYIERAKGLLMDRLGLGEADAMKRLMKQARDSRRRLPDLARALIESDQLLYNAKKKSKM